ncbi:MAG: carbamoyltransferase family protein [Bdellovibrionota bacterium]
MKILGISSNYHDAAAALVIDGVLVSTATEERFSLIKHDPSFPRMAIDSCLEVAGLAPKDIDLVAYHEEPEVKISRSLASAFLRFPFSLPTFLASMRETASSSLWVRYEVTKQLGIDPQKVAVVPHHISHAAYSCLCSPFPETVGLTLDAVGEWTSSGIFSCRTDGERTEIEPVDVTPFPHSIGLVYSSFTSYLGFRANDAECSTMALAAFGRPRFADEMRKIIQVDSDGAYRVDLSYFDFGITKAPPVTRKLTSIFGPARAHSQVLSWDALGECSPDPESQRAADIAASLQLVTEEAVLGLARRAKRLTGLSQVSLSGGVAMNCVANAKLAGSGIFEGIFVPPDPGDGGGAAGAALYVSLIKTGRRPGAKNFHPYLGQEYSERDALEILNELDKGKSLFRIETLEPSALVDETARALASGKIIGWFQGRFEHGPRALGNRSILARPGDCALARRLSSRVKKRAAFRPYALSVAEEWSQRIFGNLAGGVAPYRWMQVAATVNPELRSSLRAALHIDGTTRPQVCGPTDNPLFHQLLSAFGEVSKGPAALLNTSFNGSGLPLVARPTDALMMFLRTDMDLLVLNRTVIRKLASSAELGELGLR